jgi:hypothetical protein
VWLQQHVVLLTVMEHAEDLIKIKKKRSHVQITAKTLGIMTDLVGVTAIYLLHFYLGNFSNTQFALQLNLRTVYITHTMYKIIICGKHVG